MAKNSFPSSTLFHFPALMLLSDGKVHTTKDLISVEIERLSISEKGQQELTPGKNGNRGRNKVESWTTYAVSDLMKAGFLCREGNGYIITSSGLDFIKNHQGGFVASGFLQA